MMGISYKLLMKFQMYIIFLSIETKNGYGSQESHKHIHSLHKNNHDSNECNQNNDTILCEDFFLKTLNLIEDAMKLKSIPGMTISVVYSDQNNEPQVWNKTFGYRDLKMKEKVELNTKFGIGSCTKAFTTTLLCMLLDEQKDKYPLGLATKIASILGKTALPTHIRNSYADLMDVMSHRMALLNYSLLLIFGLDPNIPMQDFCRRMRLIETKGRFRTEYSYSNMMFVLAGCIIEVLGNDTYENLLKKKIFQPLGMKDSLLTREVHKNNFNGVSNMYYLNDSSNELTRIENDLVRATEKIQAAGGIFTTGSDMAKWMSFQINKGKDENGKELLSQDFWRAIHTTQMLKEHHSISDTPHKRPYHIYGIGLGWLVGSYQNIRLSSHGGRLAGFDSKVTIFPKKNFGIFTSANGPAYGSYAFQEELHFVMYDLFSDQTLSTKSLFNKKVTKLPTLPKSGKNEDSYMNVLVSNYLGMFGHHLFGNLTVSQDVKGKVTHLKENSNVKSTHVYFHYGVNGVAKLNFLTKENCKVVYLGNVELHMWVASSHVYQFSIYFNFPDDSGKYQNISLVSSANVTFHRGLQWDSFKDLELENVNKSTLKKGVKKYNDKSSCPSLWSLNYLLLVAFLKTFSLLDCIALPCYL